MFLKKSSTLICFSVCTFNAILRHKLSVKTYLILKSGPGVEVIPANMLIFLHNLKKANFCCFHFAINFFACKDQVFITINFNFISLISVTGRLQLSSICRICRGVKFV